MHQWLVNQTVLRLLASIVLLIVLILPFSSHANITEICSPFNSVSSVNWTLPQASPRNPPSKIIAFIASDMRNGSVETVATGVAEALKTIGWHLVVFDGRGTDLGQATALLKAQLINADGFILGGVDETQQKRYIKQLKQQDKPIIGWYSTESVVLADDSLLFANVMTSAADVGRMTACYTVNNYPESVRVIIFTDDDSSIDQIKIRTMSDTFEKCQSCEVISIENISISRDRTRLSKRIYEILDENKGDVTHFIAINDVYFDYLQAAVEEGNVNLSQLPIFISAGDGSKKAYRRIKKGVYQQATVPEPLLLQGWQIVDELNRAFNGQNPSQYSAPLLIVDKENIDSYTDDGDIFEPGIDYRSHFKALWLEQ